MYETSMIKGHVWSDKVHPMEYHGTSENQKKTKTIQRYLVYKCQMDVHMLKCRKTSEINYQLSSENHKVKKNDPNC